MRRWKTWLMLKSMKGSYFIIHWRKKNSNQVVHRWHSMLRRTNRNTGSWLKYSRTQSSTLPGSHQSGSHHIRGRRSKQNKKHLRSEIQTMKQLRNSSQRQSRWQNIGLRNNHNKCIRYHRQVDMLCAISHHLGNSNLVLRGSQLLSYQPDMKPWMYPFELAFSQSAHRCRCLNTTPHTPHRSDRGICRRWRFSEMRNGRSLSRSSGHWQVHKREGCCRGHTMSLYPQRILSKLCWE